MISTTNNFSYGPMGLWVCINEEYGLNKMYCNTVFNKTL